jgi:hypothetical protein
MKNKFAKFFRVIGLVLAVSGLVASCSVEDGVDGINGVNGINGVDGADGPAGADGTDGVDGTNGTDGLDGTDGVDGLGFDEFDDYGSIILNLEGTRPDDVAFSHEAELKFISPEVGANVVEFEGSDVAFDFVRQAKSPDSHETNGLFIYLEVNDAGLITENFDLEIYFSEYAILSDDLKYIELDDDEYSQGDTGVSNVTITDYSFDDTTNNLKFSFTMDILGDNNETENDLSISGTVDVLVFEEVESNP